VDEFRSIFQYFKYIIYSIFSINLVERRHKLSEIESHEILTHWL